MGKSLTHQDLVWVVPCVGGVDYPVDQPAESMSITILGASYEINVQYHVLRNITYVLLDAPVFRQQTKAEPYPPRSVSTLLLYDRRFEASASRLRPAASSSVCDTNLTSCIEWMTWTLPSTTVPGTLALQRLSNALKSTCSRFGRKPQACVANYFAATSMTTTVQQPLCIFSLRPSQSLSRFIMRSSRVSGL